MAMGTRKRRERQEDLWYGGELPTAPGHPFYQRLNEVLDNAQFDSFCETVRISSEEGYCQEGGYQESASDERDGPGCSSRINRQEAPRPKRFWHRVPSDPQGVHNEEDHMGRTLHLGNALVDEAALADLCRRYRVRELSVFGSAARGDMRPNSDIDLLVEFLPDAEVDLVDHAGLMLDLARLLGRKVDLVSKNGLKPLIRASVLDEAQLLYAA